MMFQYLMLSVAPLQRRTARSGHVLPRLQQKQLLHHQSSTVAGDRFTGATFSARTDTLSGSGPKVRHRCPPCDTA